MLGDLLVKDIDHRIKFDQINYIVSLHVYVCNVYNICALFTRRRKTENDSFASSYTNRAARIILGDNRASPVIVINNNHEQLSFL